MKGLNNRRRIPEPAILAICCLVLARTAGALAITYDELSPVLASRCNICHSGQDASAGLQLDSLDGLLKGSRNGPVVQADDPAGSELIRRIKGISQPRMPMTGPPFLSGQEISLFERWIIQGLKPGSDSSEALGNEPGKSTLPADTVTYVQVAPIFARRCVKCHTDNGLVGAAPEGYRMNTYEAILAATDRVRVIPGQPYASELMRRVRGQARPRMPFDGPPFLNKKETDLIRKWIEQGARNAEGIPAALPVGARIRLHGRLSAPWQLDSLPLKNTASTRIDKHPRPGNYVRVRGMVTPEGSIVVERIGRR